MHTDSEMTGISHSGSMHYMTAASLEMSDEPKKCATEILSAQLRFWTEEKCYEEASRYTEMKSFRTMSEDAYNAALRHNWLKNYTWLTYSIDVSKTKKKRQSYTQLLCLQPQSRDGLRS